MPSLGRQGACQSPLLGKWRSGEVEKVEKLHIPRPSERLTKPSCKQGRGVPPVFQPAGGQTGAGFC
jgi:hypothetical protein